MSLPDIGQLFPDNDPNWRGADSSIFMEEVRVSSTAYSSNCERERGFLTPDRSIAQICIRFLCLNYNLTRPFFCNQYLNVGVQAYDRAWISYRKPGRHFDSSSTQGTTCSSAFESCSSLFFLYTLWPNYLFMKVTLKRTIILSFTKFDDY